jgi:hypothetical protein
MDEFVAVWESGVVPARQAHGFRVVAAWANRETDEFGWIVALDGDAAAFAAATDAYYASPERLSIDPEPGSLLTDVNLQMVDPLRPS